MRFFFDAESTLEGTHMSVTPQYIELATSSLDPPGTSFLYVQAGPIQSSVTVLACWGNELDGWLSLLSDEDRADDWLKLLSSTYPTMGRLMDASAANEPGRTSLSRDIDPDDMFYKWFITVSVGNVMPPDEVTESSTRAFLSHPKLVVAYRTLLNDSFTAARELLSNEASLTMKANMYGREFVRSQVKAYETFNKWAPGLKAVFGVSD